VHVIAIDLRQVTYIDSIGIRFIVQAQRRSSQGSSRLILIRGSEAVQELFEICELATTLPFVDALPCSDAAAGSATTPRVIAAGTRGAIRAAVRSRIGQAALAAAVRDLRTRPRRAVG
jgi:hypothetical protein